MFLIRRAPRRQWPTGLRTSVSVAGPALVGWLMGDLSTGLLVSLGGFAGLYGGGRPYVNRVRLLAVVAVAQAVAVALGVWTQNSPWASVAAVTVIAVVATLLCNAFNIQPGAYQIALSCAAGTALPAAGADPIGIGLLVLLGGLIACAVSLTGALVDPHGPEREAVGAAADAIADYIDALLRRRLRTPTDPSTSTTSSTGPGLRCTRRGSCWSTSSRAAGVPRKADAAPGDLPQPATAAGRGDAPAAARADGRTAGAATRRARPTAVRGRGVLGADHPAPGPAGGAELVAERRPAAVAFAAGADPVAVASVIAGALGLSLGLSHSFWTVAAAVLVLSQGLDQRRTVQRGLERTAGTFVGLGLAAVALNFANDGFWFVVMLALAQFVTQLLVTRNYAAAAIFITCSALLMTGVGGSPAETAELLQARGLDTAIGCLVAIVVFVVLSKKSPSAWLGSALAQVIAAAAAAVEQLTPERVTSRAGLIARRDLQRRVLWLSESYENGLNGFPAQREEAVRSWPAVVAAERLAYRVLAEGWRLEETMSLRADDSYAAHPAGQSPPPSAGLRGLAEAVRLRQRPGVSYEVPSFISRDVADLRRALRG